MYQALYRKWRPKTFEDVVGQTHITRTLKRQVATDHLSHAYLFTGTRGTGKTTCAKLLAKAVNCEHPVQGDPCGKCKACRGIEDGSILDVVELDAASNNGVDQVRALRDEAIYSPAAVRRRVYIIDEVHMLSTAAFNALLKILEEPPEHLMFILATTELHKVPATILSRCQRFSFKRIQPADIQNRLQYVAEAEGIKLTEDGAALLARLADGALRDALSLLDQCALSERPVDQEAVLDALGLAGNLRTAHIMNDIRRGDTAAALTELSKLYAAGKDVGAVLSELSGLARDLLLRQTAGSGVPGLMAGGYDEGTMRALSRGLSAQRLLHMLTLLQETQMRLRTSVDRRTEAELCLIRLCDRTLDGSILSLSERLSRVEAALANGVVAAPRDPMSGGGDRLPFAEAPRAEEAAEGAVDAAHAEEDEEETLPELRSQQEEAPVTREGVPGAGGADQISEISEWEESPEELAEEVYSQEGEGWDIPLPEAPPDFPERLEEPVPEGNEWEEGIEKGITRQERNSVHVHRNRAAGDAKFWQELAPTLREAVGPMTFGFISKQLVTGMYADGVLTLYVAQEAIRQWFSSEEKRSKLAQAASAKAGRPVRVMVEVSGSDVEKGRKELVPSADIPFAPPADEPRPTFSDDPLQELLSFAMGEGKAIVTLD